MDGEGNSNWLGGFSFHPYASSFTKKLKQTIIKRDKNSCGICGRIVEQNFHGYSFNLVIHHIDYDKKNSSNNNLITLCKSCHAKTCFNRDYYKKLFEDLICKKYIEIHNGTKILKI